MNSTSCQRFHNDLKAALIAGVPLEIGSAGSVTGNNQLTTAKLSQFEKALLPGLTNDGSLAKTIQSNPEIPARFGAALQVFERTDSMPIVLDGLTIRHRSRVQARRTLRWTFIYLLFLLAVAILGMWLYTSRILPLIGLMRTDLLLPAAINAPPRFDLTPWFPLILYSLVGAFVLLLILMLTGGASRIAMSLGGKRFVRCRMSTMALRVTQILIDVGTPSDEAISVACDLVGTGAKVRMDIQNAIAATDDAQSLESLADYLTLAGNDRLTQMKTTTPVALVSIVGGGIALVYCVAVFWPIISILKDMTTAGT